LTWRGEQASSIAALERVIVPLAICFKTRRMSAAFMLLSL
jgi:hypothetical protein